MANTLSGPRRHEKHTARLDWLRAHPDLLARLPGGFGEDVTPAQSEALDDALRQMKHVRLYAPTSASATTRWRIRMLVSEIRDGR